jgi:hypothetical protein
LKTINLIYYNNGVGLTKDSKVIKDTLNSLSNNFKFYDFDAYRTDCPIADINIFFQNIDTNTINFIPQAKINILIPNPEWMFKFTLDNLDKVDLVLAKSNKCKEVLDKYHKNVVYLGFSSVDRFDPLVEKTKTFLHFAGKSIQKYTELVVDVFNELKIPITIVDSTQRFLGKTKPNIHYITNFLSEQEANKMFNSHKVHICCSLSEGWGHYIYEALSSKSIVLINDCPPENELIGNKEAFKIRTSNTPSVPVLSFHKENNYPIRDLYYTDKKDFIRTIKNIEFMSDSQIKKIGELSRELYLKIDNEFRSKLIYYF